MEALTLIPTTPSESPRIRSTATHILAALRTESAGIVDDKTAFLEYMQRITESILVGKALPLPQDRDATSDDGFSDDAAPVTASNDTAAGARAGARADGRGLLVHAAVAYDDRDRSLQIIGSSLEGSTLRSRRRGGGPGGFDDRGGRHPPGNGPSLADDSWRGRHATSGAGPSPPAREHFDGAALRRQQFAARACFADDAAAPPALSRKVSNSRLSAPPVAPSSSVDGDDGAAWAADAAPPSAPPLPASSQLSARTAAAGAAASATAPPGRQAPSPSFSPLHSDCSAPHERDWTSALAGPLVEPRSGRSGDDAGRRVAQGGTPVAADDASTDGLDKSLDLSNCHAMKLGDILSRGSRRKNDWGDGGSP